MYTKKLIFYTIRMLHILLVSFIIVVPFTRSNYFLLFHAVVVPFIIMHWLLNNNMCALTLMEQVLRKSIYGEAKSDECITCKLIEPVYDFKNNYKARTRFIYTAVILLWAIGLGRIYYKIRTGEINGLIDFLKI